MGASHPRTNTIRHDTAARHRRKYDDRSPLQRLALGRFHDVMAETIRGLAPASILDFGCGEGFLLDKLIERDVTLAGYTGLDLRAEAINEARARLPSLEFVEADIFAWPGPPPSFDLVMASQVLEHLDTPHLYLRRLASLCERTLLLTVPDEPWFQLMNLARGRDIARLGNHPEHINHWSPGSFARFIESEAVCIRVWTVFPFIFALARPR